MFGSFGRLCFASAALAAGAAGCAPPPPPAVATVLDAPRALPAVALTDQHGRAFATDDLRGRPAFVFFGFTHCPDVCPLGLAALAEAVRELRVEAPDAVPAVLFVSVDPERDSPDRIAAWLANFDAGFIGATADAATLAPLLETLAVTVHIEKHGDVTHRVTHNGTIYVLDRDARWAALFGGASHRPRTLVDDYLAMYRSL